MVVDVQLLKRTPQVEKKETDNEADGAHLVRSTAYAHANFSTGRQQAQPPKLTESTPSELLVSLRDHLQEDSGTNKLPLLLADLY